MNVKQGDLAIQYISSCGNQGVILSVKGYLGEIEYLCGNIHKDVWMVEYQTPTPNSWDNTLNIYGFVPDAWLKPVSGLPMDEDTKQEETA